MDKPKRKNKPQNALSKFWNEMLFVKHFEIETQLSPERCAGRIQTLARDKSGVLFRTRQDVMIEEHGDGHYAFTVDAQRYGKRQPSTTALVSGHIVREADTTLVTGEVKFGIPYYAGLIFLFAFLIFAIVVYPNQWRGAALLIVPMILWFWWRMYSDRDKLVREIVDVLTVGQ